MKKVYLGLGSNLGDRAGMLQGAIEGLESDDLHVLKTSSVYETEPRDVPDQPWFLNQVVEVETSLFPIQLLTRLKKLEFALGRRPSSPKGPRAIDIDILFYGDVTMKSTELVVPHPAVADRRFVLEPLMELAPELRHPGTRKLVRELMPAVQGQQIRRFTSEVT